MTTDDDMREIEAAMGVLLNAYDSMDTVRADEARAKLLALIRQKLPQTDAEHERSVEAWWQKATECQEVHESGDVSYEVTNSEIDDALRLMRARPAETRRLANG